MDVLDAEVKFSQTIGEGPADEAANFKEDELDFIAHAVLTIGDAVLMIADIIPLYRTELLPTLIIPKSRVVSINVR